MAYFNTRAAALFSGLIVLAMPSAASATGPPDDPGSSQEPPAQAQSNQAPPDNAAPQSQTQGRSGDAPGQTGSQSQSSNTQGGSNSNGGSHGGPAPQSTSAPTRAGPTEQSSSSQGTSRPSPQSGPDTGSQTPGTNNSDCEGAKDPRDPGSCQEKGRGNTYDRDPFRGPNRGNDCDEGGGNNISGEEVTNPHNADSPDDTDKGQGNNRCGTSPTDTENPPGGGKENPPGEEQPPGIQTQAPGQTPQGGVLGEQVTAPDEGVEDNSPSDDTPGPDEDRQPQAAVVTTSPAVSQPEETRNAEAKELPFTGFQALWLALIGLLFSALGARLRSALLVRTR